MNRYFDIARRAGAAAGLFMTLGLASGCVHRELIAFEDHETKPLTAVRVGVHKNYYFYSSNEYVFYSCAEKGDELSCKRLCGGSADVQCPMASSSTYSASTNIR